MKHRPERSWRGIVALLAIAACLVGGCKRDIGKGRHVDPKRSAESSSVVTVFAAASMADVMDRIITAYEAGHAGVRVQANYAASSTLARQIEAGAPADVYLSANEKWMDYLADRGLVEQDSRFDLAGNELVLIAPKGKAFSVDMRAGFSIDQAFDGRMAIGDTAHVPAGIYAAQAMKSLGWWDAMHDRLAPTADVRAALRLVASGEVTAGIVYRSDAMSSDRVEVVGVFPADSHDQILYPAAFVRGGSDVGRQFLAALKGEDVKRVLTDAGFVVGGSK